MLDTVLDLPPPFATVAVAAPASAFDHACGLAAQHGAGTFVWAAADHLLEAAVVLEPTEKLATARLALFAVMNAAVDALVASGVPASAVRVGWPDALMVSDRQVGAGRIGWPARLHEQRVPDWLVVGLLLETSATRDGAAFLRGFADRLLVEMDRWSAAGPGGALRRWRERFAGAGVLTPEGDFIGGRRHSLVQALADSFGPP